LQEVESSEESDVSSKSSDDLDLDFDAELQE